MSIRRQYESTYIMNAALEDGEIETLIQRVSDFITEHGGNIIELNKWGRRRLAYPIKKKYNGFYVHMVFESAAETVPQLERFYTLDDGIMRHLTLQLDAKLREFRKVRAEAQAQRAAQLAEEAANERNI
jgi:small subunit ribosomal protein S6